MKLGNRLSVQAKRTIYSCKTDYLFKQNRLSVWGKHMVRFTRTDHAISVDA